MFLTREMVNTRVVSMYNLYIIDQYSGPITGIEHFFILKRQRQKLPLQINSYSCFVFVFLTKASEKLYIILTIFYGKTTEDSLLENCSLRSPYAVL